MRRLRGLVWGCFRHVFQVRPQEETRWASRPALLFITRVPGVGWEDSRRFGWIRVESYQGIAKAKKWSRKLPTRHQSCYRVARFTVVYSVALGVVAGSISPPAAMAMGIPSTRQVTRTPRLVARLRPRPLCWVLPQPTVPRHSCALRTDADVFFDGQREHEHAGTAGPRRKELAAAYRSG
jgi:hypothetical protein